jgi:phage/plasmid primase-like uncharacterized protein
MNLINTALDIQGLAAALNLSPTKQGYIGSCLVCDYKGTFSLTLKQNKLLMYCHACNAPFNDFKRCFQAMGLWVSSTMANNVFSKTATAKLAKAAKDDDKRSTLEYALKVWNEGHPIIGTPVERYLINRGIQAVYHETLRYHPRLKHTPSGNVFEAMLAKVTDMEGTFLGLHRTYLFNAQKADVITPKMMLGNCKGGSVHFGKPSTSLIVCEGIETALSLHQETGKPVWAGLSTSGMQNIQLALWINSLIIAADNDPPGMKACEGLMDKALKMGISVRITWPPEPGQDFNDMLNQHKEPA